MVHGIAQVYVLAGWMITAQAGAPAPAAAASGEAKLQEAEHLLIDGDNTADILKASMKGFDDAIQLGMPDAQKANAYAYKALALMRLGDLEKVEKTKLATYEEGRRVAEQGIAADPKSSRAHFYRGANMGRWGQTHGVLKSLFMIDDLRKTFETARKLDPKFPEPLLTLAKIDEEVPGLLGGSRERAEKLYRESLTVDPHYTRAMLDLAELLEKTGRKPDAVALARQALEEKQPANPGDFRKWDRARAAQLLEKWR